MFPVIVLVGKDTPSRSEFQMGLNLCQEHCLPDKKEYIAGNGWEHIDKVFQTLHKTLPDHEASYMDFKPIEDRAPGLKK
jgi:hypothetical protein